MSGSPSDIRELSALLRLLDDETPEVRNVVSHRLAEMGSDLSEMLPDAAQELVPSEKKILSEILHPVKRKVLRDEWLTPSFGAVALDDDWELFESHLRLLSDFLHDGVSLRQPLSDALDLLAEEFQQKFPIGPSENDLRVFLFEEGRLKANRNNYYDARNSDLAWCIAEGVSNPIGLGVIYMLLGKRLGMEIEGIAFPGHFLCRIVDDGQPLIIDCFDSGKLHSQRVLIDSGNELTEEQRLILTGSADLGAILMRILNNLIASMKRSGQEEDIELLVKMRDSMIPSQGGVGG